MVAWAVHGRAPFRWVQSVVSTIAADWELYDGICLLNGIDLEEQIETLSSERTLNLFEAMFFEETSKSMQYEDDRREVLRTYMQDSRKGGTMSFEEYEQGPSGPHRFNSTAGRTTNTNRQPRKTNYIQPTEAGYPGLEPPLG